MSTTSQIKTPEQLALAVARLGRRLQRVTNRRARLNARKARHEDQLTVIKSQLASLDARDGRLIERDAAAIFASVYPRWSEFTDTQTADLGTGTAERITRAVGAMIFPDGEDAAVAEVETRFPELADQIVKTVKTIRKDPLKQKFPEVLGQLASASAPGVETFTIRAANCSEPFVLPVARLQRLAADQGLLPSSGTNPPVAKQ